MGRTLDKSNAHFRKALTRLPLGVASNFRYWGEDRTIYVKRGRGGRIWDLDDNAYVDYRLGYGPAILGYADPRVDAAARQGMEVGGVFALSTEREYAVAARIAKMVPAAELVRFSNSGTEAVMAALRLARAYTGRSSYVLLEGGYHGLFDAALWTLGVDGWNPGSNTDPPVVPYSRGVPEITRQLLHVAPMNDANRLEDIFRAHAGEIAAMLMEPIQGNCCGITADPAYVKAVRELCDRYGVVLIIDEVKSGFRVARGGVQELMGVRADLCTFAKAMANGYQIAAIGGREDIMRQYGHGVAHGGTYTAHSVALAAAEKTLQIIDETPALETIAAYGRRLQAGMSEILNARGIVHSFAGHPSMGGLFFAETPPTNYRDWKSSDYTFYDTMARHLHDEGVLCEPDSREPWFICEAHDESCLADTLRGFEIAVDRTIAELSGRARHRAAN
ncbi:glutamate-1-semialdehyde 2,1-aminomutase [Tepidamorphus gemmatus]|uniref:Glutamate-1-semialdehyde 2,1-aminomutase n=1 Tax=Tepidamorphus gemmatus TaxID=747076 RepID=A0A4R3MBU0_9HYPH|nr:aminotransferase class III-fold pyridoxal phosphate-dependent enzyme [Tepidamorphus gemmatus]TCT10602.1 glutamate-1-semialdehyde 2,1-aminomutase [Tepidamorphus gemmatus]